MFARVVRDCPNPDWCSHPHTWEYLNPKNEASYRHGRVVFFCHRTYPISTIERMRMLRR
jgi:hypothetical protein